MFDIIITIFISIIALIVATLGYLDNRKKIKIILDKENERKNLNEALNELKNTSNLLKELPNDIYLDTYFFINDVFQNVYEKNNLNLTIELQNSQFFGLEYDTNSINTISLRKIMTDAVGIKQNNEYYSPQLFLNFKANPNIITNTFLELGDFLSYLSEIEGTIIKLHKFEFLIDSFDSDILNKIEKTYVGILDLFVDGLHKKVNTIELNRNMKPSEIEGEVNNLLNYNQISKKIEYLSTEVAPQIDDLRKELIKLSFNK